MRQAGGDIGCVGGAMILAILLPLGLSAVGWAADDVASPTDMNVPMPRCGPAMDGQVFCKFGIIYECQLISPNSLERRTGWRWKADLLRGCAREGASPTARDAGLPREIILVPRQGDEGCGGAESAPAAKMDGAPPVGTMRVYPEAGTMVECR